MSNRRRLPGAKKPLPRCGHCGGPVRSGTLFCVLPDRRIICARCADSGILAQRLPCGHLGIPGMMIVADSADQSNFKCPRCTPHAVPGVLAGRRA